MKQTVFAVLAFLTLAIGAAGLITPAAAYTFPGQNNGGVQGGTQG